MADMRLDVKGKRPHFFDDPGLDTLMTALLETMSENWALRERVHALEHSLLEKGVLSQNEIEQATLPEDVSQMLAKQQQEFFHDAFRALNSDFQTRASRQDDIDTD